jgi:hypothetical protein
MSGPRFPGKAVRHPRNAASSYVRYVNYNGEPSVSVVIIASQSKKNISGHRPAKGTRRAFTLSQAIPARSAAFVILGAITFCHLLNDVMQALLPAIYPMLKIGFTLSFGQIGLLTLIFRSRLLFFSQWSGSTLTAGPSLIHYRWAWLVR